MTLELCQVLPWKMATDHARQIGYRVKNRSPVLSIFYNIVVQKGITRGAVGMRAYTVASKLLCSSSPLICCIIRFIRQILMYPRVCF